MNISILIIDDEYLVRLGIKETINWNEYGFSIIGEASDGRKGLELALNLKPDIIITDIRMPFMDGLEFMNKIRSHGLNSKVVVLTGYAEFDYVKTAMDNGASGYLLKPIENQKLIEMIKQLGEEIKQQRNQEQYYKMLENEIPAIEHKFFKDLIGGLLKDNKIIQEKIEFLDIQLKIDDNIVLLIRMDSYHKFIKNMKPKEIEELNQHIRNKIGYYLIEYGNLDGIIIEDYPGQWIGIFHVSDLLEQTILDIKEKCKYLLLELEKEIKGSFSIIISELCKELTDVSQAYKEVSLAADNKWMPGINSIICLNEEYSSIYRKEIQNSLEYIKNHFCEDITINDVAKAVYISSDYLMHLFKSQVGMTFNEYLTKYRLEKAKQYLKNGKYKINEVCRMVGYKDPKYFSQLFKKNIGMLPSEYSRLPY